MFCLGVLFPSWPLTPCPGWELNFAACCLTQTLCYQRVSPQNSFSSFDLAPDLLLHCANEDGVIDLNGAAKSSCSISQLFFFLMSVAQWRTERGHCLHGGIRHRNTWSHMALKWRRNTCFLEALHLIALDLSIYVSMYFASLQDIKRGREN